MWKQMPITYFIAFFIGVAANAAWELLRQRVIDWFKAKSSACWALVLCAAIFVAVLFVLGHFGLHWAIRDVSRFLVFFILVLISSATTLIFARNQPLRAKEWPIYVVARLSAVGLVVFLFYYATDAFLPHYISLDPPRESLVTLPDMEEYTYRCSGIVRTKVGRPFVLLCTLPTDAEAKEMKEKLQTRETVWDIYGPALELERGEWVMQVNLPPPGRAFVAMAVVDETGELGRMNGRTIESAKVSDMNHRSNSFILKTVMTLKTQ